MNLDPASYPAKVNAAIATCLRALQDGDDAAFRETIGGVALPSPAADDDGWQGFTDCLQAFLGNAVPTDDHNPLNDVDFADLARDECQLHVLRLFAALRQGDVESAHDMLVEVATGLAYWLSKLRGRSVSPRIAEAVLHSAVALRDNDPYWLGFLAVCGCQFFHHQGDHARAREWLEKWSDARDSTSDLARETWRAILDDPERAAEY